MKGEAGREGDGKSPYCPRVRQPGDFPAAARAGGRRRSGRPRSRCSQRACGPSCLAPLCSGAAARRLQGSRRFPSAPTHSCPRRQSLHWFLAPRYKVVETDGVADLGRELVAGAVGELAAPARHPHPLRRALPDAEHGAVPPHLLHLRSPSAGQAVPGGGHQGHHTAHAQDRQGPRLPHLLGDGGPRRSGH